MKAALMVIGSRGIGERDMNRLVAWLSAGLDVTIHRIYPGEYGGLEATHIQIDSICEIVDLRPFHSPGFHCSSRQE